MFVIVYNIVEQKHDICEANKFISTYGCMTERSIRSLPDTFIGTLSILRIFIARMRVVSYANYRVICPFIHSKNNARGLTNFERSSNAVDDDDDDDDHHPAKMMSSSHILLHIFKSVILTIHSAPTGH